MQVVERMPRSMERTPHAGRLPAFLSAASLLGPAAVAVLANIFACNTTYDEPEIWRAAPGPVAVPAGEVERTEVRGCVYHDSMDVVDDAVAFIIVVNAEVESQSDGTAQLAMTYDMVGDEFDEYGMNVERTGVAGGRASALTEDHVFLDLPVLLSALGRSDACSAWKTIDFSWGDVSGEAPLEVNWEVGFRVEVERGAELGIDFRSYPND